MTQTIRPAMGNSECKDVRRGSAGDCESVAAVLARAFHNYPTMAFLFPDEAERERRLPRFFRELVRSDQKTGAVFLTSGGEAATLWRPPGCAKTPFVEKLLRARPYLSALGPSLGRALKLSEVIESHMPSGQFWYLHVAGCDPAAQGKGFGGAVIRAGLEQVVGSEMCYLHTATERNVEFYRSLGFEVLGDWNVADGPHVWSMLRPKIG